MRDLVAQAAVAVRLARGRDRIQRHTHGPVTGSVDLHGETCTVQLCEIAIEIRRLHVQGTACVLGVLIVHGVGLQHGGGARGRGNAIQKELHETRIDMRRAVGVAQAREGGQVERRLVIQHQGERHRYVQIARPIERLIGARLDLGGARVLEGHDATAQRVILRGARSSEVLRVGVVRHNAVQHLEALEDHTVRHAVCLALEGHAFGIGRVLADTEQFQRACVHPVVVTGVVLQHHRLVAGDLVQEAARRRNAVVAEEITGPVPTADPLLPGLRLHAAGDGRLHLLGRGLEGKLTGEELFHRTPHRVRVRIDQARNERATAHVAQLGGFPAQRLEFRTCAERHHLAITHSHGLGAWLRCVHREDVGVEDQQLRGRHRRAVGAGAQQQDTEHSERTGSDAHGMSPERTQRITRATMVFR